MEVSRRSMVAPQPILIIACGALSKEIATLVRVNRWEHLRLTCLDAELHNRPELIAPKLRLKISKFRELYEHIFVAYGDCGSGGEIDQVILEFNIERLPGVHCYSFLAGEDIFDEIASEELGTFFLTDFLAEHFDRLVMTGLKIGEYPELRDQYFRHYKRLVYISQTPDDRLLHLAEDAANKLALNFEHRPCGSGPLMSHLKAQILKFASS